MILQTLIASSNTPASDGGGGGGGGGTPGTEVLLVNDSISRLMSPAGWRLNASGVAERLSGGGTATWSALYTWLVSGTVASYQVRATLSSGWAPTSGTLNTWTSLSTTQTWFGEDTTLLIEARRVSDSVVVATCTITLYMVEKILP